MVALRSRYAGAGAALGIVAATIVLLAPTPTRDGADRATQPQAIARRPLPVWAPPGARASVVRPIAVEPTEAGGVPRAEAEGEDITGALAPGPAYVRDPAGLTLPTASPGVNRAGKADRLVPRAETDLLTVPAQAEAPPPDGAAAAETAAAPLPSDIEMAAAPGLPPEARPEAVDTTADSDTEEAVPAEAAIPVFGGLRLYFDSIPIGVTLAAVEPWPAGEAPVLVVPAVTTPAVVQAPAAMPPKPAVPEQAQAGVTIAGKGEVTGETRRPMSPAERLRLSGKARTKAERCLANAVYFEARSEPVRGQIAVAQVVLNRAFSGYYPSDICGVVYQGANRHLSCQFTFACDGIPDIVTDAESWDRAKRIARAALDGKLWLNEIGKATHYHALYVNPYWVRSMRRLHRIGLHSFYRPRLWGSGADAPSWGTPQLAELVARL